MRTKKRSIGTFLNFIPEEDYQRAMESFTVNYHEFTCGQKVFRLLSIA